MDISKKINLKLDIRLDKYENGEMKFSSWDSVKDRIRDNAKDAL